MKKVVGRREKIKKRDRKGGRRNGGRKWNGGKEIQRSIKPKNIEYT